MAVKMVKEELVRALVAAGVFQVAPSASTLKLMKRDQLQAMLDEHDAKVSALEPEPTDADLNEIEATAEPVGEQITFPVLAALTSEKYERVPLAALREMVAEIVELKLETPAERLARLKAAASVRNVPFATKGRTNLERRIRKLERKLQPTV